MDSATLTAEINRLRAAAGEKVLILGHHYQDSAVVQICDAVGDSLELSRIAAASSAERIIFCGVKFMAETADILSRGADGEEVGRSVWLPAPQAGCPMADMATAEALEAAWAQLTAADPEATWVPIVYVNSTAEVKAFCGRHGGSACTSGNGKHVLKHYLDKGAKIFFAPDQHLCTNILRELDYPQDAAVLWNRELADGGVSPEAIRKATLVAWSGCCPIHAGYTVSDVETARAAHPNARLLIHPEAPVGVSSLAEQTGSTKGIIDEVKAAPAGAKLLIGTEQHLVSRLMADYPQHEIHPLRPIVCDDMGLTTLEQVHAVLTQWPETCRIRVETALVPDARACVERMLAL